MSTHTGNPIRGSTASSALPPPRTEPDPASAHPRHTLGDVLRAVGVFLDSAFRVAVLGSDGTWQPDPPRGGIPGQGRR